MNTAELPAVPAGYDDLGDLIRVSLQAEAPAARTTPWPPPYRLTRRQRRQARKARPVSRAGAITVFALANTLAVVLLLLVIRRYGVHIDWARFAASWPA